VGGTFARVGAATTADVTGALSVKVV